MDKRLSRFIQHISMCNNASQELIDAINAMVDVAYKKKINNHEIWHQCKNCGDHFDLRMDSACPNCGTKPQ